jgi:hypothetical protein
MIHVQPELPFLIPPAQCMMENSTEQWSRYLPCPLLYPLSTKLSPTCSHHSQQWPAGCRYLLHIPRFLSVPPAKTKPQPAMRLHPPSRVAYTLHHAHYIRTKHQDHFSQLKPANVVILCLFGILWASSAVHSPFNLVSALCRRSE